MVDRFGYESMFPLGIVLEVAVVAIVWRWLQETRPPAEHALRVRDAASALLHSFVPPRGLRGFFLATALDTFSWGMGWGLLYGLVTQIHHFSGEQLGLMASVMSLSWAIMQFPIGRYIHRRKLKPTMLFSEATGIPLMLLLLSADAI